MPSTSWPEVRGGYLRLPQPCRPCQWREGRDEIRDFEVGDRIDLSKIAEALGGLAFAPFADDGSPAPVNRITFYHETFSDSERTVVRAVIDLERDEDLEFLIAGRHALTEQDFILAAFETAAEQRDA